MRLLMLTRSVVLVAMSATWWHSNVVTSAWVLGGVPQESKRRRQVYREDVSPLLGGKIPSAALEWTRLMFNNLDSRGISIPNGFLPSPDRASPDGVRSDERHITFLSNDSLAPYIESTYLVRLPVATALNSSQTSTHPMRNETEQLQVSHSSNVDRLILSPARVTVEKFQLEPSNGLLTFPGSQPPPLQQGRPRRRPPFKVLSSMTHINAFPYFSSLFPTLFSHSSGMKLNERKEDDEGGRAAQIQSLVQPKPLRPGVLGRYHGWKRVHVPPSDDSNPWRVMEQIIFRLTRSPHSHIHHEMTTTTFLSSNSNSPHFQNRNQFHGLSLSPVPTLLQHPSAARRRHSSAFHQQQQHSTTSRHDQLHHLQQKSKPYRLSTTYKRPTNLWLEKPPLTTIRPRTFSLFRSAPATTTISRFYEKD